jgi:prevent-host-death family protein
MPSAVWSLQDAKNRFSEVVRAARMGTPQVVTRRGERAVVVLAAEAYDRLKGREQAPARSFTEHLLAMPRKGAAIAPLRMRARDVNL